MARPFTEEEDQIIILCLAKATSPNISDALRKASTLTGRSFNSIYSRYYQKNRFDKEAMKKEVQEFEDWKLIINFLYNEPIKSWVTQYNYKNLFKEDWELLMQLIEKIEKTKIDFLVRIETTCTIIYEKVSIFEYDMAVHINVNKFTKKLNTYYACIEFIKYQNKKKDEKKN